MSPWCRATRKSKKRAIAHALPCTVDFASPRSRRNQTRYRSASIRFSRPDRPGQKADELEEHRSVVGHRAIGQPRAEELIDQYTLALLGAGLSDRSVANDRAVLFEFIGFLARPVWTAEPDDADRYLVWLRRDRGLAKSTVQGKAWAIARFFDFLVARHQGDIYELAECAVVQPIDEFNRPVNIERSESAQSHHEPTRSRRSLADGRTLWSMLASSFPPRGTDLAASLWRRVGLRIRETVMLDVGDWHPELGEHGKLHVRFGKGSKGRGAKTRLVPAINSVGPLIEWWLDEVRPQFDDDSNDPGAPLLPSERRDPLFSHCGRIGTESLRAGLADEVARWLPDWSQRLTPHGLRHYCASSLYERGMDLKAIQDLLGHEWLSTTTRYIHVHDGHIEHAWAVANERIATRIDETRR